MMIRNHALNCAVMPHCYISSAVDTQEEQSAVCVTAAAQPQAHQSRLPRCHDGDDDVSDVL